ncbi:SRPBCC domain-containing protein [Mumia sp. zg.B21]|uniref:SRPBCC domain-containing protein n=1 Tax=unclassified Mumia TaxID=2621872 RepID=UPI001C6E8814|nr:MULTISPECIES: SRPBCC domain-containing protein [unclassified Mumia]MBW9208137.1 SRPBCC domain-containing protein [Mumia sp. zg.B21]MDD9348836.1 SRPBCC domain-containing protein [Mumia sp.]
MSTIGNTQDAQATTVQVYQILVKTTPEKLWEALVSPQFTAQYFYGARISVTPEGYEAYGSDGSSWGDTEVMVFDPPRRLVHGWTSAYDPELASEPLSRVTWEIEPRDSGVCLLTVVHDQLEQSPGTARSVAGVGWMTVLSGLKTLLETGEPLQS